MAMRHPFAPLSIAAAFAIAPAAQAADGGYRQPPEPLLSTMRAPLPPALRLDPTGKTMLELQRTQYPPIARVAEPYVKLAGVRVEPASHARHDMSSGYGIRTCLDGLGLLDIASGKERTIALPAGACPAAPLWSPDGRRFAFNNTAPGRVELWIGDVASGTAHRVEGVQLNPVLGGEIQWLGSERLLVKTVPAGIGAAPKKAMVPAGPDVQESLGGKGESSTYEARDTMQGPEDEALFEYYATSQLATVDADSGKVATVGVPAVHTDVDAAPDARHVRIETLKRPYSHATTYERFAHDVSVLDLADGSVRPIASLPVADAVPVHGVPTGPRDFAWRANQPATLTWAEALDGGDWKATAPARDRVLSLAAPFSGEPVEIAKVKQRYAGLSWFADGSRALLDEYDENRHWRTTTLVDVDDRSVAPRVLWDLSYDELYDDPGSPQFRVLPDGAWVLREDGGALFLSGQGATPKGDRPFLDRYDLATGKTTRLFRSGMEGIDTFAGFADGDPSRLLAWSQSPKSPPNLFLRTLGDALPGTAEGEAARAYAAKQVTRFPDPTPLVRQIRKQLVTYKRKDGVALSFTLYTPPGYKAGTRVPAVLYAYPLDYSDPSQAGQVSGADEREFTRPAYWELLALAGYAIIDNAAFPIVGDPKDAYDTYIPQLIDDAQAAVDAAVATGVVDRDRIGITGHSHGALMTANLLARSDLFRAGVATSGSYNKTLTPFGFQNERRSFWTAPAVYADASAFIHPNEIKEPLQIVHGKDDANPGTETIQSPKLFQAIRGNGGTARLVLLPFEPHWYTARESNEDVVAEMLEWFDRYVKNAPPRAAAAAAASAAPTASARGNSAP
jgi:dipeptidyl aminopeptidase/acylaminoacyl peptidase